MASPLLHPIASIVALFVGREAVSSVVPHSTFLGLLVINPLIVFGYSGLGISPDNVGSLNQSRRQDSISKMLL